MSARFNLQVASDALRDGLAVELLDGAGEVVAEVFRCDRDHTVLVSTFSNDVSLEAIEHLLAVARTTLDPFKDGRPLSEARFVEPRQVQGWSTES
jgi:hypothetical protein